VSVVEEGVLTRLSVSQAEKFDPAQTGGCPRRWWFEEVRGHKPEQGEAQSDGEKGHALLAHYLATGEEPQGRVKMGKAVRGAIAAGHLPTPRDVELCGGLIEHRFDGQAKHDAQGNRIPLRADTTLWLGGVPWDGYVDLRLRRMGVVEVWDHKFSSDIHANAKPAHSLIRTVQMPVYALDSLRVWPSATEFRLVHHYVSRVGVDSFIREQTVTVDQIQERGREVAALVDRIRAVAVAQSQDDVPFSRKACSAYSGCPHQSICTAFKENRPMPLSAEDLALFGDITPEVIAPTGKPTLSAEDLQRMADEAAQRADESGNDGADVADAMELQRAAREARAGASVDLPLPAASVPAVQPVPVCADCATELNAENGSRSPDGKWTHLKCPASQIPDSAPKRRGRPPKARTEAPAPSAPLESDVSAALVERERDSHRRTMAELDASERELKASRASRSPPEDAADRNCVSLPDGTCVGGELSGKSCMHDPVRTITPPPLSGTLRVVIDVSPGLQALLERIWPR
jgi:hypothetical protein